MSPVAIVCRALITDPDQRILLVRKTGAGFWSLPGGKLDTADESMQACLLRELREELGVEAHIESIHLVHDFYKNDAKNPRYVEIIWNASLDSLQLPSPENIHDVSAGELEDIRWVRKGELANMRVKPAFLFR